MTLILAYQDRGKTFRFTIDDTNGNPITPGSADQVRATIGREGEAAQLVVASDAPTSNGSTLAKGNPNTLRLDATDLAAIEPGTYSLMISFFDSADADEWKTVDRQTFSLQET